MILAQRFLAHSESPFQAYMALQRALMIRYLQRGGSLERWCHDLAPRFRERYSNMLDG